MDGNGRWAKKLGGMRIIGHQRGARSVTNVIEAGVELGLKYITLYAFSSENWNRPQDEISGLMDLLSDTIDKKKETLMKHSIRLMTIGDINMLPAKVKLKLEKIIALTAANKGLTLTLALSYSGRNEIVNAVKKIVRCYKEGNKEIEDINEQIIKDNLYSSELPDPELLIRTSGEIRVSNFLLWQIAYTELYFTNTLWPDFGKDDFYKAICEYQKRERRFGKTGEQLL